MSVKYDKILGKVREADLTQTAADALYLKLTAANQTLTGNLAITGTLGAGATTTTEQFHIRDVNNIILGADYNDLFYNDIPLLQFGVDPGVNYSNVPFRMYWSNQNIGYGAITIDNGDGSPIDFVAGNITGIGNITGGYIIKSGGTSSQFLKANGSVDSSTYYKSGDNALFGTLAAAHTTIDTTMLLQSGSITDSSGAITFTNENLSTTGTLATGNITMTGTALKIINTKTSGMVSEASGTIVDFGTNYDQLGGRDATAPGALFRIDTRTGYYLAELFSITYRAAGGTEAQIFKCSTTGDILTAGTLSIAAKFNVNSNGVVTKFNNVATEGYGVPAIVDHVALTAQSASIGTTNFTNAGTVGLYRVNYYLEATTLNAGATSVLATFGWTDAAGATTTTSTTLVLTALGRTSGIFYVQLASGNLTYATTLVDISGLARYALYMTCERVN